MGVNYKRVCWVQLFGTLSVVIVIVRYTRFLKIVQGTTAKSLKNTDIKNKVISTVKLICWLIGL